MGEPLNHRCYVRIFHEINHPAIKGYPMTMETPMTVWMGEHQPLASAAAPWNSTIISYIPMYLKPQKIQLKTWTGWRFQPS